MKDNLLTYLLLILIVYLIFKISSNTCNGFSVGSQIGCVNPGPNPTNCPTCCPGYTCIGKPFGNKTMYECKKKAPKPKPPPSSPPSPPPLPPPPSGPPKITLQPYDKDAKGLFNRLKKAYNDPTSNGVFGSMIFNNPTLKENFFNQLKLLKDNLTNESPQIYLDGSGSIIRKDIYTLFYGAQCNFGFIWDTDWLKPANKKPLVSCLFPADAWSCPFKNCEGNNKGQNFDSCTKKAADTSNPNRCSSGLSNWYGHLGEPTWPNPNECTRNIGYKFHEPTNKDPNAYIDNYSLSENCFESMVKGWRQFSGTKTGTLETYNEGVFLEDVRINGIEIGDGLKELNKLNRPLPSALLFNYNDTISCTDKSSNNYYYYKNILKVLIENFSPETVVIKIKGNTYKNWNFFYVVDFDDYTTLDKMPEYNIIKNEINSEHGDCSVFDKNDCETKTKTFGNCMWYNPPGQTAKCVPALKGPCDDFGNDFPVHDCEKCEYGWGKSPVCKIGNTREGCSLHSNGPASWCQPKTTTTACKEFTDYDSCMGGKYVGSSNKSCKWDWQKNTCTDPS